MSDEDARAELDRLIRTQGESYASVSRLLGRNPAYVQQHIRRGTPRCLSERDRRRLARYFGVSERLLGGGADAEPPVAVPHVDARVSAGPGGFVDGDRIEGDRAVDPALVRELRLTPGALSWVTVIGDSMEPTLVAGDRLLIDHTARAVGPGGGIYVLRADGVVMVKRVRRVATGLQVMSDNPAAPPFASSDPDVIGRVVQLERVLR